MSTIKLKMSLISKPQLDLDIYETKFILPEDISALGESMLDAFSGTPDYIGETLEELTEEISDVVIGGIFPLIKEASYLIEIEGTPIAAIMINLYQGEPLVSEIFTTKPYLGKGLASFLLRKSIHTIYNMGYKRLFLYVHPNNTRAIKLYEKIGFSFDSENIH